MGCKWAARLLTRQSAGNGADYDFAIASGHGDEPAESRIATGNPHTLAPHCHYTFHVRSLVEQLIDQDK